MIRTNGGNPNPAHWEVPGAVGARRHLWGNWGGTCTLQLSACRKGLGNARLDLHVKGNPDWYYNELVLHILTKGKEKNTYTYFVHQPPLSWLARKKKTKKLNQKRRTILIRASLNRHEEQNRVPCAAATTPSFTLTSRRLSSTTDGDLPEKLDGSLRDYAAAALGP